MQVLFKARSTSPDLLLTVKVNDNTVYSAQLDEEFKEIEFFMREIDGAYTLDFILSGKSPVKHTTVDSTGNIVHDEYIEIKDLIMDTVPVGQIWFDNTVYYHNYNGTGYDTESDFFGTMGCNGTARFKFECPFYMWYLETLTNQ